MFMKNNMKIIPLLCAVITSVALAREQPNIILIVADDLGYGDTGVYGSDIKTPTVWLLRASAQLMRMLPLACARRHAMP
jgi:arylsulfatase